MLSINSLLRLLLFIDVIHLGQVDHWASQLVFIVAFEAKELSQTRLIRILLQQCTNIHGFLGQRQGGVDVEPAVLREAAAVELLQELVLPLVLRIAVLVDGIGV